LHLDRVDPLQDPSFEFHTESIGDPVHVGVVGHAVTRRVGAVTGSNACSG